MKNVFPAIFNGTRILVDGLEMQAETMLKGGEGYVAIRPEDILIRQEAVSGNRINVFGGKVLDITDRGPYYEISAKTGKVIFKATLTKGDLLEMELSEKKSVSIAIRPTDIHVF